MKKLTITDSEGNVYTLPSNKITIHSFTDGKIDPEGWLKEFPNGIHWDFTDEDAPSIFPCVTGILEFQVISPTIRGEVIGDKLTLDNGEFYREGFEPAYPLEFLLQFSNSYKVSKILQEGEVILMDDGLQTMARMFKYGLQLQKNKKE